MAERTILEEINFLEQLPQEIGKMGEEIMKHEFSRHTKTGHTIGTIHYQVNGNIIFVGSEDRNAKDAKHSSAYFVQNGRGWVYPKDKKILHWKEGSKDIFARSARPAPADDFVGRTAERIRHLAFFD